MSSDSQQFKFPPQTEAVDLTQALCTIEKHFSFFFFCIKFPCGRKLFLKQWFAKCASRVSCGLVNIQDGAEKRENLKLTMRFAPRGQVRSPHAIRTWVRNFEETGSALKKKAYWACIVCMYPRKH
jgi:hypothetical protein